MHACMCLFMYVCIFVYGVCLFTFPGLEAEIGLSIGDVECAPLFQIEYNSLRPFEFLAFSMAIDFGRAYQSILVIVQTETVVGITEIIKNVTVYEVEFMLWCMNIYTSQRNRPPK